MSCWVLPTAQHGGPRLAVVDVQGGDDPDLARALAASLADRDACHEAGPSFLGGSAVQGPGDADLAAAIAASLVEQAQGEVLGSQPAGAGVPAETAAASGAAVGGTGASRPITSADLASALQASLQQVQPPQGPQFQPAAAPDGAAAEEQQPALPQLGGKSALFPPSPHPCHCPPC